MVVTHSCIAAQYYSAKKSIRHIPYAYVKFFLRNMDLLYVYISSFSNIRIILNYLHTKDTM